MRGRRIRRILCVAAALLCALPAAATGQERTRRSDSTSTVSPAAARRLVAARDALDEGRPADARRELAGLLARRSTSATERALAQLLRGYAALALDDPATALRDFEASLAEEALPEGEAHRLRYAVAQLLLAEGRFERGIAALEAWLADEPEPPPTAHYLLAAAHAQGEDWVRARPAALRAVEARQDPPESWLRLLVACHLALEETGPAIAGLERLVAIAPRKAYWLQLAVLHQEQGQGARALAVLEVAHELGLLDSAPELRSLASLALAEGLPERAARVTEEALARGLLPEDRETLERLGDWWIASRETEAAVAALERASRLGDGGSIDARLGRLYAEQERWQEAQDALERALARGGLPDRPAVQLLLGIAALRRGERESAIEAFRAAEAAAPTRDDARRWLRHLGAAAGSDPAADRSGAPAG